MQAMHRDITKSYKLNVDAAKLHRHLKTDHVNPVNVAIENEEVPQKSKGTYHGHSVHWH